MNTSQRDRNRHTVAHGHPACALCGQPIDYTLAYPDPMAFTVDHKVPRNLGGTDDPANLQAAHFRCNRAKSDRTDGGPAIRRSGSLTRPD